MQAMDVSHAARSALTALAILFITSFITSAGRAATDWSLDIQPVASPASGESAQPQLSSSADAVILSWIERTGPTATLKFASRTANGWSEPRTVASGTDWFVNWADVPSVVSLADGRLAAHWLQKSGTGTYAYDVRLSFSNDGGKTWSSSVTPHHDGTQTEHGFASLVQMPAGGLGLVWLDGRAMTGGHDAHGGGDMSVRSASFDRSGRQVTENAVDTRVCECCPTAAAVTADGIIAAYRDRSAQEVRDIYVARLANGTWSEPVRVHEDGWTIPACPVNGPALSARGRDVAIAWFTMKNEKGHAQVAFSKDAGRSFGAPVALADSDTIGRVDVVLLDDGSAVASWIEVAGQRAEFKVRRVDPSGARSAAITVAAIESGRGSGYPRVARHGEDLVFAWIAREGGLRVKTAAAKLPRVR
jgi:BNR repeat-like domain